ncbi:hypothetical protein PHAVU_011G200300 [Phaseolus vulgaris]
MAEIVTGALFSVFLDRTIDTLASRFVHIFGARKHNKKQLSHLKMKLLAIDVVAFDAEQKQFTDPRVRDWLLRAKDVVFDAEDLLEEIDYELFKTQVEAESQSATNKVWNSLKSSFVTFFENEIESRMEQVTEDLEDLATQSDFLGLKKVSGVGVGSASSSKLTYTSLPNESVMYGRDEDRDFVFNWLTSDTHRNLSILSIVGMGGLGKTSLAQHVFNDPRIEGKFDIKAWISVPQEFDVLNVSRAILDTITGSTEHSIQQEVVQRRLKEKLTGKKFLLVLDDNWNENQSKWEQVQKALGFGAQGSRLLVTTRSKNVANAMRSEEHLLQLLRKDYCWDLFAKHAFQNVSPQPDPDFVEIGKKIVEKCNGLPLALKTMGSLLHNKSSFWEWESIMKSEIWDLSENDSDILPALRLSYVHLPSHLKKCFAFCALFPKGYEFDKECLIQLWLAENFLESPLQKKSPKEVGEQYFNDLLSWSFFQQSGNEAKEHFIMHDLLNDLAKYVNEDICIRLGVDEPKELEELPSCLHQLYNLRCLEFINTGVKNVPPHLGKLKNLQVLMSSFDVEKSKEFSIQQLGELNLHGSLTIHELQNIENPSYALEADLKNKPHLVKLYLEWNIMSSSSIDSTKAGDVIENLRPSKHLKELSIWYYIGKQFPNWLLDNSLPNLVSLELRNCICCQRFPPLGLLPFLKKLEISGFDEIVSIDADFHGNNSSSFKSLERLEFQDMKQWEKWECQAVTGAFPNLQFLVIRNCPKLKGQLPEQLVPLKILHITDCQQLEASTLRALDLELRDCGKLQLDCATMKKLRMEKASLLEIVRSNTLEDLRIDSPLDSLLTFQLDLFPTLRTLDLCGFDNLEMISQSLILNHLKKLTLKNCPKFESLPGSMHMLLPSLRMLYIRDCPGLKTFPDGDFPSNLQTLTIKDCPKLESFPDEGFPSNLQTLTIKGCTELKSFPEGGFSSNLEELKIEDCPRLESFPQRGFQSNLDYITLKNCSRLVGSLKGAFGDSSSLKNLWIDKLVAKCFPDEDLLPVSLTSLSIYHCPNLEKLEYKGLYQLSSLQTMTLFDCPNLQRLPEEGLPKSILSLTIKQCPLLEQRFQKEGDEDWEKIAHIQKLYI